MALRLRSIFADTLKSYLELKIATGTKMASMERYANYFDDFAIMNNITTVRFPKELHHSFYSFMPEQGDTTKYIRVSWTIGYLNYLSALGYDVSIPRLPRYVGSKEEAYIFSNDEIRKYFSFIDSYYSQRDPMVALYLPVIFRVLYGCGTRIGETLSLKVRDIDLDTGILILRETKNGKEREIVVGDDLKELLTQYATRCLYLKNENDYFFSHIDGRRISEQSIYHFHRKALADSNIKYYGDGKGPRLHDLRHTFAVTSLSNFEQTGHDIRNVLPILQQYLGHSNVAATERYLRLSIQHFDEVINKTQEISNEIFMTRCE